MHVGVETLNKPHTKSVKNGQLRSAGAYNNYRSADVRDQRDSVFFLSAHLKESIEKSRCLR
jgi:hypothetical protein